MSDDKPVWDITRLTDEELAEYTTEQEEEGLRRKRLSQWWVCMACGTKMGYDYMEEGDFDEEGCIQCSHPEAVKVQEAATE